MKCGECKAFKRRYKINTFGQCILCGKRLRCDAVCIIVTWLQQRDALNKEAGDGQRYDGSISD